MKNWGGHFTPELGGHFELESGGHFKLELGGQYHQNMQFSVNSVAQYALNDYIEMVEISKLGDFYQQKRDFFRNLCQQTRFELLPCEGSYFQIASYKNISTQNDIDFTQRLVTEFGVATIPLSPFYFNGKQTQCIRFCFAKDDDTLQSAVNRLLKL